MTASAAAYRRHQHLVTAAGAAVDLFAGTELEVLAEADPHLAEPPAVAGDRDGRVAEPRIDLDEGSLQLVGRDRLRLRQLQEFLGNLHGGAGLADGLEIGALAEAQIGR